MIITDRVVKKYMRRSGCADPLQAKCHIKNMTTNCTPVEMKPTQRVLCIINNDFKEANYYKHGEWILVEVDGVLKTTYQNDYGWF